MSRRKLWVRLPDGRVATRETERDYRFVIVAEVHKYPYVEDVWTWAALRWSTRLDLAEKALRSEYDGIVKGAYGERAGQRWCREAHIVPVVGTGGPA